MLSGTHTLLDPALDMQDLRILYPKDPELIPGTTEAFSQGSASRDELSSWAVQPLGPTQGWGVAVC